jgi:hypothetical protein
MHLKGMSSQFARELIMSSRFTYCLPTTLLLCGLLWSLGGCGESFGVNPDPNAIAVDANRLTRAFAANELDARDQYNQKLLLIEGRVALVSKEPDRFGTLVPYLILLGHDESSDKPVRIHCEFNSSAIEFIRDLTPGTSVVIQGKCTAPLGLIDRQVSVIECQRIE